MTKPIARVGPAARRDLNAHVLWLREEADVETADRFADAAIETFAALAASPGLGSPVESDRPGLSDLRKWPIDGFPNLRAFYVPITHGVRIVRILHVAQDWTAILSIRCRA